MVYQATTRSLIEGVISGYNATVFAYGPTGKKEKRTQTRATAPLLSPLRAKCFALHQRASLTRVGVRNGNDPSLTLPRTLLPQRPQFLSHLGGCIVTDSSGSQNYLPNKASLLLGPCLVPALLTINLSYPGCGKTYTMLGTDHEPGIYVRTLNDLFRAIEETSNDMEYEVSMSYLEVSPHQAWLGGL